MGDDKLTRYQKQQKGKQGQSSVRLQGQLERKVGGIRESVDKTQLRLDGDKIDSIFGFDRMTEGLPRVGWLLNYLAIVSDSLFLFFKNLYCYVSLRIDI